MRLCHHPVRWQPASTYVAGRRFATYGLAHLVLAPAGEVDSEKAAHRFAAAFLVPGDTARRELGIVSRRTAASQLADMRAWGWEDAEPSEGVAAAKYRRAWSGWCFALSRRAR